MDNNLLPHLFRVEYSKLTAVLCRLFGLKHIEIAEDIASETFLKATEIWSTKGLPENPTAWLYTVAKNKTRDYLRRNTLFEQQIKPAIRSSEFQNDEPLIEFFGQNIKDSQLEMIFSVCDPVNPEEAQVCLALQILCGFSVEEIADAFLSKKETIKKRLTRARANLRTGNFRLIVLQPSEIVFRLDTVLTTIYLLFNEGYFSTSNNKIIRKDLCSEAIRLALILTGNPLTDTTMVNALLALMCFQSSRLEARIDERDEAVLFDDQDKDLWDKELIGRGNYHLVKACQGDELSKYHLEAGIAYWHTTPADHNKWEYILPLYDQLILIDHSPVTALNRIFALAKVQGSGMALKEAEKFGSTPDPYYHSLMGYLYSDSSAALAIDHYTRAAEGTKSLPEKKTLEKKIERLKANMKNSSC